MQILKRDFYGLINEYSYFLRKNFFLKYFELKNFFNYETQ